jgi:hypothetical protein
MGIIKDTTASFTRIRDYGNQMRGLLSRHEIHNVDDLKRLAKDSAFKSEVTVLWKGIIEAEGGKVSLTLILGTIAVAMGGVGIAAGGGAIGLPLLLVLAPAGYFAGQEFDSEGYTKSVANKFTQLWQMASSLDSEQCTGVVADKFHELLANVQKLEAEGYTKKAVERINKLFHKAADPLLNQFR